MLSAQRKDHLLGILRKDGRVVAKQVAVDLGVSEDSIRRDLRELADAGALVRVYGGALPIPPADRPIDQRADLATASKQRVAQLAVSQITPGATIVLDAGTTTLAMTRMLPYGADLTVITPSPAVALSVAEHSEARIVIIGGELSRFSMVAGGPLAMEAVQQLAADLFFLGVTGIDPVHGLTTGDLGDAATKRAIAARCTQTLVLGSEEKIGATSRYPVLDLERVAGIVVDPLVIDPVLDELAARVPVLR